MNDLDALICKRCNREMELDDVCFDPTDYCNTCAQDLVIELQREVDMLKLEMASWKVWAITKEHAIQGVINSCPNPETATIAVMVPLKPLRIALGLCNDV